LSFNWVQLVFYECDTINGMFGFTYTIYKIKMRSDILRLPVGRTGINVIATKTLEQIYNAYIILCYVIVTCYPSVKRIINKGLY